MSVRFTGDKTGLRRTTGLPSQHDDFAIVGFVKLLVAQDSPHIATLAYTQNGVGDHSQSAVLGGDGTKLRAGDVYGTTFSADAGTLVAGGAAGANWYYFALEGVGSGADGLRIYFSTIGGTPTFEEHTNGAGSSPFSALQLGDLPYGSDGWLDGLLAHVSVFDRKFTAAEHLAQAAQPAPVSSTGLISYNEFSDPDIADAVIPNIGTGTWEFFTSEPTTSTDMPVFSSAPTLTIADSLPQYDAAAVAPEWGTVATQSALIGTPFSFTPTLAAGSAPLTFSKPAGASWASVDPANGQITGLPFGSPGATSVTVRASNPYGDAVDLVVPINVTARPLAITTLTLPAATVGTPYVQRILVNGGVAPYTLAVTGGAPPAGTALVGDTVTGTPTTLLDATMTVTVTDSLGATASRTYTIAVNAATVAPPGNLVATPSSLTLSMAAGPVSVLIKDANGGTLSASRVLAARAEVSKPGFAAVSRFFVGGNLIVTPVARGSGTITVVYGDQVNEERTVVIPFTVGA